MLRYSSVWSAIVLFLIFESVLKEDLRSAPPLHFLEGCELWCAPPFPVCSHLLDFALRAQQQTVTICWKLKLLITMSVLQHLSTLNVLSVESKNSRETVAVTLRIYLLMQKEGKKHNPEGWAFGIFFHSNNMNLNWFSLK